MLQLFQKKNTFYKCNDCPKSYKTEYVNLNIFIRFQLRLKIHQNNTLGRRRTDDKGTFMFYMIPLSQP